jgi:hypothetical protein
MECDSLSRGKELGRITSESRSWTNPPEASTKLETISANSSTPSSFTKDVSEVLPVLTALRMESVDRKETNEPLVCNIALFERSSTIVALTFGFADNLEIVSETLFGTVP